MGKIDIQAIRREDWITEYELSVISVKRNQLLIDFDIPMSEKGIIGVIIARARRINKLIPLKSIKYQESRTDNHWHIVVELFKNVTFKERQMYELMFGSDPCRAIWNLYHYRNKSKFPEMLCNYKRKWIRLKF